MPSLGGRITNVRLTYQEELLFLLDSYDVKVIGSDLGIDHVAVYLEDDQANLDRAREALDRYDYGYVSAYTYDKLTLVVH